MNLLCQLNTTNFTATNFQWTVPGYAISNYLVAADSNSAVLYTSFPTNSTNAVFYWVDGATNRIVQCTATIQGKQVTAQATFDVLRPMPSFFLANAGVVAADTNYSKSGLWLHFGMNSGTNVGIAMTLTNVPINPNSGFFYGEYFLTQLVSSDKKADMTEGTNVVGLQRDLVGLDNQLQYGAGGFIFPAALTSNPLWTDSPGIRFGGPIGWVSDSGSFNSYLMFQPLGTHCIAVPMCVGTWGWSGSAVTNGAGGGTLLSNAILTPTVLQTINFPQWTLRITNNAPWSITNLPPFNEN
jgi:hypothetical protein